MKRIHLLICLLAITFSVNSQVESYSWPTGPGQALLSDKYKVYIKVGNSPELEIQVLMSNGIWEGDWMANEVKGRTFSFVNIGYNNSGGPLTFRVVKLFGNASASVVLNPKSYYITHILSGDGKEIQFSLNANSRYLSVNFTGTDNETSTKKWIKHMLCLFIDPPETDKPLITDPGVVVYSDNANQVAISNASLIYFPAGYHNLKNYLNGGIIATDGTLKLNNGQDLYLEGGAFVEGIIDRQDYSNSNQKIYGRGILTGRQYMWTGNPAWNSTMNKYGQIVNIGNNAEIKGVTIMDSPMHGIVGRKVNITNLKFLGWHSNNDGVRVGSGSEIKESFIRAVDDHFYNFDIWVHNCVLWAGHNGSIVTYGWGGDGGNTYNSGSSLIENIDIINPEWISLGNNNGLIMSQTGLDYRPYGYGGSTMTVMRNIRIEGSIPGITNMKPRSGSGSTITAKQVADANVGYLGDLILENISVESQYARGLIKGKANASYDGTKIYYTKNISMSNVVIGGVQVTKENVATYFDIESNTVLDITVNGEKLVFTAVPLTCTGNFKLFPNPAKEYFEVHSEIPFNRIDISIYNLCGNMLCSMSYNSGDIAVVPVRELLKGIYLVKLSEGNQLVSMKKLIVN